jgi:hypothetical protein
MSFIYRFKEKLLLLVLLLLPLLLLVLLVQNPLLDNKQVLLVLLELVSHSHKIRQS